MLTAMIPSTRTSFIPAAGRGVTGMPAGRSAVTPASRTCLASPTAYQRALVSMANERMLSAAPAGMRRMQTV